MLNKNCIWCRRVLYTKRDIRSSLHCDCTLIYIYIYVYVTLDFFHLMMSRNMLEIPTYNNNIYVA
jgi:hypothetical protein